VFARQEVLNTELARLLCQQGLIALPEQRLQQGMMPDLLLPFRGFYLLIEAEVDDQPHAQERAWHKAVERVEQGLAHLALALVYPAALRGLPINQLTNALRTTPLRFSLCAPPVPDAPDWRTGDLNALVTTLQHAYQSLASEDEVRAAVERLKQGVNLLAEAIYAMQVPDARLAEPLGIDARAVDPTSDRTDDRRAPNRRAGAAQRHAVPRGADPRRTACEARSTPASIAGSMHDALLTRSGNASSTRLTTTRCSRWRDALLENLPPDRLLDNALGQCVPIVRALIRQRVMLRHDLAGRIYHLLLGDIAKPLGTFYTAVPSATLLLRLALAPDRWHINWEDPAAVGRAAPRRLSVRYGHAADGCRAGNCGQLHALSDAPAT
jgi:hypothetical protein